MTLDVRPEGRVMTPTLQNRDSYAPRRTRALEACVIRAWAQYPEASAVQPVWAPARGHDVVAEVWIDGRARVVVA